MPSGSGAVGLDFPGGVKERPGSFLPRLLVGSVLPLATAVFLHFQPAGSPRFFLDAVVPISTGGAFEPHILTHDETAPPLRQAPARRQRSRLLGNRLVLKKPSPETSVVHSAAAPFRRGGRPHLKTGTGKGFTLSMPIRRGEGTRPLRPPAPLEISLVFTPGSWSRPRRPRSCLPRGWRNGGFPPWRWATATRRSS